jgi:hypothetical protein
MSNRSHRAAAPIISSLILATLLASAVAGSAAAAAATSAGGRITRGDVTSAFQARTTGGFRNLNKGTVVAAPVRGLLDGRINFFSGGTYCSADWHYLGVTVLADGTHQVAAATLATDSMSFDLDGAPVTGLMRTAVKPFVGPGTAGQLGVSVGKLLPPGSLSTGWHHLTTFIVEPLAGSQQLDADFLLTADACS